MCKQKKCRSKNDTKLQKGIKKAEEKIKRKRMKVRNSVSE